MNGRVPARPGRPRAVSPGPAPRLRVASPRAVGIVPVARGAVLRVHERVRRSAVVDRLGAGNREARLTGDVPRLTRAHAVSGTAQQTTVLEAVVLPWLNG